MLVNFNHLNNDGVVTFQRNDEIDYVYGLVLKAIRSGETVTISYSDGSSTVINPKE